MNYFLSIETSTEVCSVCLHTDEGLILELHASASYQHTKRLTVLIQSLFDQTGLSKNQLNAVGVSAGPGSYTGLRVGVSTAKGMCYGLDVPLIAVSTLEALAIGAQEANPDLDFYIPMIDARRMEVYAQLFDCNIDQENSIEAVILDENSFKEVIKNSNVGICGNGMEKFKPLAPQSNVFFINTICNAQHMTKIVLEKYDNNQFESLSYFEPTYFKAPNITKSKKNIFT